MTAAMRRFPFLVFLFPAALLLSGCSGLDETEQRTLTGAAIGAGAGTAVTVMTGGCVVCGTAVGAGAGAAAGYVYDQIEKDERGR